ncbi:hypothetical protein RchiOBHm_Chr6g0312171 [Rosa chinensis]|uniref:Uncharacterized protein n=1 Tax=Rosa chinensis TaxID=74649 RepID=A0A2P6Q1K2_ROSCH|nr:hypothetical protein RchiOBHm_Chr6g0312171 [Rosa chinensis]
MVSLSLVLSVVISLVHSLVLLLMSLRALVAMRSLFRHLQMVPEQQLSSSSDGDGAFLGALAEPRSGISIRELTLSTEMSKG